MIEKPLDRFGRRNKILNHHLYIEYYQKTEAAEAGRRFCRHNMSHFLDVARLAMIINEKEGMREEEDLIYAAALLHDIGRFRQYEDGTPHEQASGQLAPLILKECGYSDMETDVIIEAIQKHRDPAAAAEKNLNGLLYRGDKMSRSCFACPAEAECDWKKEKKNRRLQY